MSSEGRTNSQVSEAAKMNMQEISMKEFKQLISDHIDMEMWDKPILCLGKSGIGKTEAMMQIAKEKKIGYVELRLVNYTETDIIGIPVPKEEGGQLVTRWAQMGRLPSGTDDECGILVLDEVTSAAASVRAAAFQLMDASRSVGDYHLPEKWLIVALGNGPEDGGVYQGLEAAFLSRCMCVRVDPNVEAWKNWAMNNSVNPAVIAFFNQFPDKLWDLNLDAEYGAEVYPCPRSWVALSKVLNRLEEKNGEKAIDESIARLYASFCVGVKTGAEFAAFYVFKKDIIEFNTIASGKATVTVQGIPTEVLYLQSQCIIKGVGDLLKAGYNEQTDDWDDATYVKVANCAKYILALADKVLDIGLALLKDLTKNCAPFHGMVIDNAAKFDEKCPELMQFIQEHKLMWSTN